MKAYKITKLDHTTYNGCKWGENVTHETDGKGELCGPGWLHYYEHPLLAVLHNPIHADYKPFLLWEAEAEGEIKRSGYMKAGCTKLTTIRVVDAPEVSMVQRVAYGIYCALEACDNPEFTRWADRWLSGDDRSRGAADAAARSAVVAARAAWVTWSVADAAAGTARAAARVARAALAAAARAAWVARAAAALAAEEAAWVAEAVDRELNLVALAEKAMQVS